MNPDQLALGALLPFIWGGILYLRHRHENRSWWFFVLWPGFMAAGALWAVVPDLPRLVGAQSLYLRLSRLPICDIFFGHYTIDQIEFDSPIFVVAWFAMAYAVIAAALDALIRAEKQGETRSEEERDREVKAPAAVHYSVGWLVITLAMAPGLWRAWNARHPLGRHLTRWVVFSSVSGIWAILPSLGARVGISLPGPLENGFWGYGWISTSVKHAQIAGPAFMTAILALQYGVIVACYYRVTGTRHEPFTSKYKT